MTRIVEMRAQNVKRLVAVNIKPDGSVVEITGKNGQGKSSVLDAIMYALGGKSLQPTKPIRAGASKALVSLDLGDLEVKRTWTAAGSYLTVTPKGGKPLNSPQDVLDKLVGDLSFDPLDFVRRKPAEQVSILKQITGLDFAKLDAERESTYSRRTEIGRRLREEQSRLAAMPEVDAPDAMVDVTALAAEQAQAMRSIRANDEARATLRSMRASLESHDKQIADAESFLAGLKAARVAMVQGIADRETQVSSLVDPDVQAITDRIASASTTNDAVRAKATRATVAKSVADLFKSVEAMTAAIEKIDETKRELLASAKMPIEGLGFGEGGVTLNGIPFEQSSSAEQLRASVGIAIAQNPELRIMLIRDGSLLDADSLAALTEAAESADAQVWLERVTNGEQVGVVIEDGHTASALALEASDVA